MPKDTQTIPLPLPIPDGVLSDWHRDPLTSYFSWISSIPMEESTRKVKKFMWGKWVKFTAMKRLPLEFVEYHHLAEFFEKEKIAKAHRQRYLRMIERVYAHLATLGLSVRNPGTQAGQMSLGTGQNDPTVFLDETDLENLEKVIKARFTEGLVGTQTTVKEKAGQKVTRKKKRAWMRMRDAGICALMLGAGVSVLGVVNLTVSCTNSSEGHISLPSRRGQTYEAVLLPIGEQALDVWLNRRRLIPQNIGDVLFPADAGSRRRPETASPSPTMAPSSIFRAVRNVLAEAGITGARACGQTLRNTYAASLIRSGFSDEDLVSYMDFSDITSAIRMRAAWNNFLLNKRDPVLCSYSAFRDSE